MLINEVDAIPQRNRYIYQIQRKEGGARKQMPPRGFTHLMHSVAGMLSTRNKTSKTVAATGNSGREEETKEAR